MKNISTLTICIYLTILLLGGQARSEEAKIATNDDKVFLEMTLANRCATLIIKKDGGWACTFEGREISDLYRPDVILSEQFPDASIRQAFDYLDANILIKKNETMVLVLSKDDEVDKRIIAQLALLKPKRAYTVLLTYMNSASRWGMDVIDVRPASELGGVDRAVLRSFPD